MFEIQLLQPLGAHSVYLFIATYFDQTSIPERELLRPEEVDVFVYKGAHFEAGPF